MHSFLFSQNTDPGKSAPCHHEVSTKLRRSYDEVATKLRRSYDEVTTKLRRSYDEVTTKLGVLRRSFDEVRGPSDEVSTKIAA